MEKARVLREFLSFIRIETCFFITGISLVGYAMFSKIDHRLPFLFLAIFLFSGASYGYNCLKDREEDGINNRKLNYFVLESRAGGTAIASLILSGFLCSLFLPFLSFIVCSTIMLLGMAYSGLRIHGARIKEMLIIKNVFTGVTIALSFIAGAFVSGKLDLLALSYFPFMFLFGLTLNILGDIRGREGDMLAKVKTIPVIFGEGAAKMVVYSITALFVVLVVIFWRVLLLPLVPFMLLISFFLHRDDHRKSRMTILMSFIFFSAFMLWFNLSGGV